MIKNLLKIAYRNIWKNKVLAIINISGLAIGISTSILIAAIVFYEISFEGFHNDPESIHRIVTKTYTSDGEYYNKGVPVPLGYNIEEIILGIEKSAMFFPIDQIKVENNKANLAFQNPDKIIYCDRTYFELFNYKWLAGNISESLSNPNEVVLTSKRAKKYFPNKLPRDIIGKVLIYNDTIPITVVGVVSDLKNPTDLYFQEFISKKSSLNFGQKELIDNNDWLNSSSSTQLFIKIEKTASIDAIKSSLSEISKKYTNDKARDVETKIDFLIQPLDNLHFNTDYGIFDNSKYTGNISLLIGLSLIAIFLLLLSCINFINLNTAQGLKRSKEIGIRKTLGSSRKQLIFQFLAEALFLSVIATILSVIISMVLLGIFSSLIPGDIDYSIFKNYKFIAFIFLLVIIVTLLSGFYPALVLSSYRPSSVLKGGVNTGKNKMAFRKSLTIFQFVIAQLFIITTLFVEKQTNFLLNKDIGFKVNSVVSLKINQISDVSKRLAFTQELTRIPEINAVSMGDGTPFQAMMAFPIRYKTKGNEILAYVIQLHGDTEYRKLYKIELLAGRERLNDTIDEFIINETYSKILGFNEPKDAIGNSLYIKQGNRSAPIVGVMKDFNNAPLNNKIEPLLLTGNKHRNFSTLNIGLKGNSDEWSKVFINIENRWRQMFPDLEYNIEFVGETLKRFYEQEQKTAFLMKWATVLAILISCMGLIGLVIYTMESRTKEIGIRKLLGATLSQLNFLIIKEFLILVGIGFVISAPLAYLTSEHWLSNFAYKIQMHWWIFILGALIMMGVTLIIISFKIISSVRANLVDSLLKE